MEFLGHHHSYIHRGRKYTEQLRIFCSKKSLTQLLKPHAFYRMQKYKDRYDRCIYTDRCLSVIHAHLWSRSIRGTFQHSPLSQTSPRWYLLLLAVFRVNVGSASRTKKGFLCGDTVSYFRTDSAFFTLLKKMASQAATSEQWPRNARYSLRVREAIELVQTERSDVDEDFAVITLGFWATIMVTQPSSATYQEPVAQFKVCTSELEGAKRLNRGRKAP